MLSLKKMMGVVIMVIGILALAGFESNAATFNNISVEEVASMINQEDDFILLDVRTPGERSQGYIKGSIHIPVDELSARTGELEKYKNKKVVVYCYSGKRSTRASRFLVEQGFDFIHNMTGGIVAWKDQGRQVVR